MMRSRNSLLNFISVYFFYILKLCLDLIRLSAFLNTYGQSLHSLHQVYVNIFQCLSIVESGLGIAVVYKLYKPLANNDTEQVNIIYSSLTRLFRLLGVFIIASSFIISFGLPFIIKENIFELGFLQLTFMIYVAKETVTYFLCSPQFVITADHKRYKINALLYGSLAFEQAVELFLIKINASYAVYLIPSFFIKLIVYIVVRKIVFKNYPWLKYVKENDDSLKKDVFDLFFINIFDLIHTNADVIMLSALTSPLLVSIYSFYNYIVKFTFMTVGYVYSATKNGLGNMTITASKEELLKELKKSRVLYSFISVLLVTMLYFSMSKFIGLWAGQQYVVSEITLCLFLAVIYLKSMINEAKLLVEIYGLFIHVKWWLLFAGLTNIVLSLALIGKYQMDGVLLATVLTDSIIVLNVYSYVGYKHLNGKYSLQFAYHHLVNLLVIIVVIVLMNKVNVASVIVASSLVKWLIYSVVNSIIILLIVVGLFVVIYHKEAVGLAGSLLKKLIHNK